jgi:hypothetical protein
MEETKKEALGAAGTTDEVPVTGNSEDKIEWYFRPWAIVVAIVCAGPLGLPLLWFRPRTGAWLKISVSVLVVAATIWMVVGATEYYEVMMQHMQELSAAMEGM